MTGAIRERGGERAVAGVRMNQDEFVWTGERVNLTLTQEGDSWSVVCRTQSPLFGPTVITYEARHRLPKHAAWDVLARVSRATNDDEEGVRVGQQAARWMRSMMWTTDSMPTSA